MSFKDANRPATRRGLVHRSRVDWQASIRAGFGGGGRRRLALATVTLITTKFDATAYEVKLPRVPWLREQSYINVQSIQPVKFTEFVRKAPGTFEPRVMAEVDAALKRWLRLK